jgi:hypothetical protein
MSFKIEKGTQLPYTKSFGRGAFLVVVGTDLSATLNGKWYFKKKFFQLFILS